MQSGQKKAFLKIKNMVAELKNSVWSLDIQVEEFFQKVEKKKIKKWKIGVKKKLKTSLRIFTSAL